MGYSPTYFMVPKIVDPKKMGFCQYLRFLFGSWMLIHSYMGVWRFVTYWPFTNSRNMILGYSGSNMATFVRKCNKKTLPSSIYLQQILRIVFINCKNSIIHFGDAVQPKPKHNPLQQVFFCSVRPICFLGRFPPADGFRWPTWPVPPSWNHSHLHRSWEILLEEGLPPVRYTNYQPSWKQWRWGWVMEKMGRVIRDGWKIGGPKNMGWTKIMENHVK